MGLLSKWTQSCVLKWSHRLWLWHTVIRRAVIFSSWMSPQIIQQIKRICKCTDSSCGIIMLQIPWCENGGKLKSKVWYVKNSSFKNKSHPTSANKSLALLNLTEDFHLFFSIKLPKVSFCGLSFWTLDTANSARAPLVVDFRLSEAAMYRICTT